MKHFIFWITLAIVVTLGVPCTTHGQTVQSFDVRLGTLEINADPKRRYVFRVDGVEKDVFDEFDILAASGERFPGLPNLRMVGIRCKSGNIFEHGKEPRGVLTERFRKGEEVAEALIFVGATGERLEVKVEGRTPVYRVDLRIEGGLGAQILVLWRNVPPVPAAKSK
jgi:hypothetical protein